MASSSASEPSTNERHLSYLSKWLPVHVAATFGAILRGRHYAGLPRTTPGRKGKVWFWSMTGLALSIYGMFLTFKERELSLRLEEHGKMKKYGGMQVEDDASATASHGKLQQPQQPQSRGETTESTWKKIRKEQSQSRDG